MFVALLDEKLARELDGYHQFTATFDGLVSHGEHLLNDSARRSETGSGIKVRNIVDDSGKLVADEVYLETTSVTEELDRMAPGDVIEFKIQIECYKYVCSMDRRPFDQGYCIRFGEATNFRKLGRI